MKLFKTIKQTFKRMPRKALILAVLAGGLIAVPLIARAEFYPARPTFDYNKPCNPSDSDPYDRCGSLTGPVFDSFINTPSYGDERSFVDARRSDQTASGSFKNVLPAVTGGSKDVVVRMYIHNNANPSTNNGIGVAHGTNVRVLVPTGTGTALRARGYIGATNATPNLVEDTVDFTDSQNFSLEYVPGSATLYDNDNFKSGVKLSDSIVTTGAPIGSDALDGNFKGCFEFEAVVQLHLKVKTPTPPPSPKVNFTKQVALPGQAAWGESVTTKPGDHVKWLMSFSNKGTTDLTHVKISDKLPPHLALVPGSVHYIDAAQDVKQNDGPLFTTGGIDFATWKPNGGFYVKFETTTKDDFDGCQVSLRNIAYNDTDQTDQVQDTADVTIKKPNCQPQTPIYSCDMLNKAFESGRTYRFTTDTTAEGGATVKQYNYDIVGNNNYHATAISNKANGQYDHTFPAPGDYVVTVSADFNVNGQVKSNTSNACKVSINIPKENCKVPGKEQFPPNSPECKEVTLVNTGPGDVLGIFAATTLVGAMLYRLRTLHKFNS